LRIVGEHEIFFLPKDIKLIKLSFEKINFQKLLEIL
jgi:hypothetical protein